MKINIWDKNWQKGIVPEVHSELVDTVTEFAPGKKILEVGFGSGGDLNILSQKGFDCYGVETSEVVYKNAKKSAFFKPFLEDGIKTSFKDSDFDLIFHQGVMEHFKNPKDLLREHWRILKNDGVLVIDVPHKWNLFTIYKNIRQFFGSWYGGWERSYSADELKNLLEMSGFEFIEIRYRGIWPHRWGKFLFPERIIEKKWAGKLISCFPLNLLQRLVKSVYNSSHLARLLSSYNIIIVARIRQMKIGFDARYAEGDLVGVGKFIRSLVLELGKLGIQCVIFYSRKPKFEIKGKNIKSVILPAENRYHFEQILLPTALKNEKVDLYHAPGNIGIPLLCPVPSVLTVHDIIPLEIKGYFSYSPFPFLSKLSYLFRLRTSLAKASLIVTDSTYVKKQIIKRFNIPENKIKTIYLGASEIIKGGILPKGLVGMKYILNNGGMDIRKNQDKLIEAFAEVHKKLSQFKLVITGENLRIKKQLNLLIEKLGLGASVVFTGYVNDKTLDAIIRGAELICYPTLSEGFGFPVLEGFGAGVPVISSNTSSIPEVADKAALLVNPVDVNEISNAMEKVLTDPKLARVMVLKGRLEYTRFSWIKSAKEYFDLYKSI